MSNKIPSAVGVTETTGKQLSLLSYDTVSWECGQGSLGSRLSEHGVGQSHPAVDTVPWRDHGAWHLHRDMWKVKNPFLSYVDLNHGSRRVQERRFKLEKWKPF